MKYLVGLKKEFKTDLSKLDLLKHVNGILSVDACDHIAVVEVTSEGVKNLENHLSDRFYFEAV